MAVSVRKLIVSSFLAAATVLSMLSIPSVTQAAPPSSDAASAAFITGPVGGSPLPTPGPKPTTGPKPTPAPPAPKPSYCVAVVVRPTNFRTGPGTGYRIIRLLPSYTMLKVYARRGAWLSVTDSRGQRGWVWQPNVRISSICAHTLAVSAAD